MKENQQVYFKVLPDAEALSLSPATLWRNIGTLVRVHIWVKVSLAYVVPIVVLKPHQLTFLWFINKTIKHTLIPSQCGNSAQFSSRESSP